MFGRFKTRERAPQFRRLEGLNEDIPVNLIDDLEDLRAKFWNGAVTFVPADHRLIESITNQIIERSSNSNAKQVTDAVNQYLFNSTPAE